MEIVITWILFSALVGVYAANYRGRSGIGFFFISVCLSPVVGLIIALMMPPQADIVESRALASGKQVKCPFCAELIKKEAVVCKHCGREVPGKDGQTLPA